MNAHGDLIVRPTFLELSLLQVRCCLLDVQAESYSLYLAVKTDRDCQQQDAAVKLGACSSFQHQHGIMRNRADCNMPRGMCVWHVASCKILVLLSPS